MDKKNRNYFLFFIKKKSLTCLLIQIFDLHLINLLFQITDFFWQQFARLHLAPPTFCLSLPATDYQFSVPFLNALPDGITPCYIASKYVIVALD